MELGPHLQAYVETKPVIDALRLCNRFGQGPDVHINKLPQELIAMIEEELQVPRRATAFDDWDQDFACFEGRCDLRDHFEPEEIDMFMEEIMLDVEALGSRGRRRARACPCGECGDSDSDPEAGEDADSVDSESDATENSLDSDDMELVDKGVYSMMMESDSRFEVHWSRRTDWQVRVCQHADTTAPKRGKFSQYDKILESDFGLKAVISHQRIKSKQMKFMKQDFDLGYDDPPKTTICYLTLLNERASDEFTCHDLYTGEDGGIDSATVMSSLIDPASLIISEKQRQRFGHAMKILGLKPYVHFTQVRNNIPPAPPSEESKKKEREKTNQPRGSGPLCHQHSIDAEEMDRAKVDMEARIKKLEKSKWPKLMSLVTSNFSCPI